MHLHINLQKQSRPSPPGKARHRSLTPWQAATNQVDTLTDRLGKKVDSGIKEVVVALRAHSFLTTGSCEGHPEWGEQAPWIDVGEDPPMDTILKSKKSRRASLHSLFRSHPRVKRLRDQNLLEQLRLLSLLDEFYAHRSVPAARRLVLTPVGIFGAFRLATQGGPVQQILRSAERRCWLRQYRTEMKQFAAFLKQRVRTKRSSSGVPS